MYRFVITEKPSVAQAVASVLGANQRRAGYLEGSGWLVSWCLGHLAELADAAAYDPDYAKWRLEDLPILPESWRFTIAKDKRNQFDTLRTLLRREDVAEVVNACDAGREGELIFRTVYALAGCSKPISRLWISSMEDTAIREGFAHLRPGRDYDGLHQAALCRAKADWLVGINATRLFSLLYGRTLNIGRVVSPTLALIVQREAEIAAFQPEPFYTVELDCGGLTLSGERMANKKEAQDAAARCQGNAAVVQSVERREKAEKPPALYDLTTLQREANRTLGYTAQQTLDYLQALYEKKLCTYPRTDSRFLTDDMEAGVPALAAVAAALCGVDAPETVLAGPVCNSARVSDHHAIVPTASANTVDLEALPIGEREILRLVSLGLLRAVSSPHRYAETCITAMCGGDPYTAKRKEVLSPGWKVYARTEDTEAGTGPDDVAEGQSLPVFAAQVKAGRTTPPKHYTEDTLLSAMETAGADYRVPTKPEGFVGEGGTAEGASFSPKGGNERYGACDDAPEDAGRRGIGTPATRAATLEKLVSAGFVQRKKAKKVVSLLPTPLGTALITVLPEALQSPALTAEWEHRLKEVERGTLAPEDFMAEISAMLRELVGTVRPVEGGDVLFPPEREAVGRCPRCGRAVTERKQGFFCEERTCGFAIWKNNRWWENRRKTLTRAIVAALLKDGRAPVAGLWSEKAGRAYNATVELSDDGTRASFHLVFDP
ncbi:DNA topoisomerase III [Pseudoflavonifractor phocaeensis]|nr:DNA topoisomerase [Pseudoflavonifractor phocaeensis]MBM6723655.1 DNA topoisomerase III [Pseudoflavonifractor phocaeensis]